MDALRGINPHKAIGFDGLSLRMLQLVADEIAESLMVIFNKVIQESEWPMEWKKRGMGTSVQERGPSKRSQLQTSNFVCYPQWTRSLNNCSAFN